MKKSIHFLIIGALVTFVTGLFPFNAFAMSCTSDGTLNSVFCSLATEFSTTPKLLSILSWVGAVILAVIGFINLKEYGDDPNKVPLRGIIVKFVIAVMLISLPLVMSVIITSVTGEESMASAGEVSKPRLGNNSIGGR